MNGCYNVCLWKILSRLPTVRLMTAKLSGLETKFRNQNVISRNIEDHEWLLQCVLWKILSRLPTVRLMDREAIRLETKFRNQNVISRNIEDHGMVATMCVMKDPVQAADGKTYDREAIRLGRNVEIFFNSETCRIQNWLQFHKTSPLTNVVQ